VPASLQSLRMPADAHMAAVVGKEAGGCDHQHPVG
jgi:hypothetical protein